VTEPTETLVCLECRAEVECCAFCERDDCSETICYKCLRIALGQALAQPHVHGG
jgi:hypothetical protein